MRKVNKPRPDPNLIAALQADATLWQRRWNIMKAWLYMELDKWDKANADPQIKSLVETLTVIADRMERIESKDSLALDKVKPINVFKVPL